MTARLAPRARIKRSLATLLATYLISRAAVVLVAAYAFRHSSLWHGPPMLRVSPPANNAVLSSLASWDAGWYLHIAQHGYQTALNPPGKFSPDMAFFPLVPLLIRAAHLLTGLSYEVSGSVLVFVAGAAATLCVWGALRSVWATDAATKATMLWLVLPGSFVLSLTYAEAFTVLFAAACLWALAEERWWLAGGMAALAGLTQPVGCALVFSCVWAAWSHSRRAGGVGWRSLAAVVPAPLGTIAYMSWLWSHTGDPLAWFTVESRLWDGHATPLAVVHLLQQFVATPGAPNAWVPAAGLGFIAVAVVALAVRKAPAAYWTYGLGVLILALLSGPVQARPRILEAAFPLSAAVGAILPRWLFVVLIPVSVAALLALTAVTVSSRVLTP